jgi:hypothetical protein
MGSLVSLLLFGCCSPVFDNLPALCLASQSLVAHVLRNLPSRGGTNSDALVGHQVERLPSVQLLLAPVALSKSRQA